MTAKDKSYFAIKCLNCKKFVHSGQLVCNRNLTTP